MGNRYALCVGVNNGLDYAEKDAWNMYNFFIKQLEFTEAILLIGATATIKDIEDKIKHFKEKTQPDDLFIFYYSGHSTQFCFEDSRLEESDLEALALSKELLVDKMLKNYWYDFKENVDILVILATCFADGYAKNNELMELNIKPLKIDDKNNWITECIKLLDSKLKEEDFLRNVNNKSRASSFFASSEGGENKDSWESLRDFSNADSGYSDFTYSLLFHFDRYNRYNNFNNYYEMFESVKKFTLNKNGMGQIPIAKFTNNFGCKKPFQ